MKKYAQMKTNQKSLAVDIYKTKEEELNKLRLVSSNSTNKREGLSKVIIDFGESPYANFLTC